MGHHTACEKGSCLHRLRNTAILCEHMFTVCMSMEGRCGTYFRENNMEIKGVCHILYPYLLQTVQQEQEETNCSCTENNDTNADKESRQRGCIDCFQAVQSNGAHGMFNNHNNAG